MSKCEKCNSVISFKNRYVLGTGYPIVSGQQKFVGLTDRPTVVIQKEIKAPAELCITDTPKYRLVLERVK